MGWGPKRFISTFTGSHEFKSSACQLGSRTGRIFDIGCGIGTYVSKMNTLGLSCSWIEPDSHAFAIDQRRGHQSVHSTVEQGLRDVEGDRFSAISLNRMLEHLADLRPALRVYEDVIAPSGSLVDSVPNCDFIGRHQFGECRYLLDLLRHVWHVVQATLGKLLHQGDFNVPSISSYDRLDLPLEAIVKAVRPASIVGDCMRSRLNYMASIFRGPANLAMSQIISVMGVQMLLMVAAVGLGS